MFACIIEISGERYIGFHDRTTGIIHHFASLVATILYDK